MFPPPMSACYSAYQRREDELFVSGCHMCQSTSRKWTRASEFKKKNSPYIQVVKKESFEYTTYVLLLLSLYCSVVNTTGINECGTAKATLTVVYLLESSALEEVQQICPFVQCFMNLRRLAPQRKKKGEVLSLSLGLPRA